MYLSDMGMDSVTLEHYKPLITFEMVPSHIYFG